MSRESCIVHRAKQAIAIVRQDYYQLMERDACGAALLNIFEYWANATLAADPNVERPWVGARPIREFEQMMLGIATDKQIRKRLAILEDRGFIQTRPPAKRGAAKEYQVLVPEIQRALVGQMTDDDMMLRSFDQQPFGQMTEGKSPRRSFDQPPVGQMTRTPSVKQPNLLRSNDRALKKNSKELKKEDLKEVVVTSADARETDSLPSPQSDAPIQIGIVSYTQPPESIDLSELWDTNPGLAKAQLRFMAPGHKRLEIVARGLGQWWVGPGLNDFDECLIKACQKRKRKFQQPDGVGDAKTFLNNMIRNGDWANLELRCSEATALKKLAAVVPEEPAVMDIREKGSSPFEKTEQERKDSALGLARFKVGQGLVDEAEAIAKQFGFSLLEIGLVYGEKMSTQKLAST